MRVDLGKERLIAFLYMLMRDKLPTGEVERLVREVEKLTEGNIPFFSNGPLEEYSIELAHRICPEFIRKAKRKPHRSGRIEGRTK